MSLTVLIDQRDQSITIVPWFQDPKQNLEHACGPVERIVFPEFRAHGLELIKAHFVEYKTVKKERGDFTKNLGAAGVRKFKNEMKNQAAIRIDESPIGILLISPQKVDRYDLTGLLPLPRELEQRVPMDCAKSDFFRAFDEAASEAARSL